MEQRTRTQPKVMVSGTANDFPEHLYLVVPGRKNLVGGDNV